MTLFAASFSKLHRWTTTRRSAVPFRALGNLASTALFQLLGTTAIQVDAHGDVTEHAIVDAHTALELGDFLAGAFDLQQHKRAVFVVQNLVSHLAFAHDFVLRHRAALVRHD